MIEAVLVIAAIFCGWQAIRSARLLSSALWLAGTSALVAIIFYALGAAEIAVIELSVGAGLVTVLFVFAISISGEELMQAKRLIPKPLAIGLVLLSIGLLGWMILPGLRAATPTLTAEASFSEILWQQRGLDVLVQIVLVNAGVLGLLGLLAEVKVAVKKPVIEKRIAVPKAAIAENLLATPVVVHEEVKA